MNQPVGLIKHILDVNVRKLSSAFKINYNPKIIDEFACNTKFISHLNDSIQLNKIFKTRKFESIFQFYVYRNLVYYLIRQKRPKLIIETGVLHGLTTSWILQALHDNNYGNLISIDLPRRDWDKHFNNRVFGPGAEGEEEIGEEKPGWIIPDYLRKNWNLVLGSSEKELKKICDSQNSLDIFIHDSDHSYQTMKYECDYILSKYANATLVIDDFNVNNYTYEILSKGLYNHILMEDVNTNQEIISSTAFLQVHNI